VRIYWFSPIDLLLYTQDGDETVIYDSAQALISLQRLFGLFPRILAKGDHAAVRLDIIYEIH